MIIDLQSGMGSDGTQAVPVLSCTSAVVNKHAPTHTRQCQAWAGGHALYVLSHCVHCIICNRRCLFAEQCRGCAAGCALPATVAAAAAAAAAAHAQARHLQDSRVHHWVWCPQVCAAMFFSRLAVSAGHDLVPVSTVLLMAERALDALEAASADGQPDAEPLTVLFHSTATLRVDGNWQQLDSERAMSLGIGALQYLGEGLHVCRRVPLWLHVCQSANIVGSRALQYLGEVPQRAYMSVTAVKGCCNQGFAAWCVRYVICLCHSITNVEVMSALITSFSRTDQQLIAASEAAHRSSGPCNPWVSIRAVVHLHNACCWPYRFLEGRKFQISTSQQLQSNIGGSPPKSGVRVPVCQIINSLRGCVIVRLACPRRSRSAVACNRLGEAAMQAARQTTPQRQCLPWSCCSNMRPDPSTP
jgi:hypothetical protein